MLDQRWIADLFRQGDRRFGRAATGGRLDILCQIPVVVVVHLLRRRCQGTGLRQGEQGNDADRAVVLVRVVVGDFVVSLKRVEGAYALVVGNDELLVDLVEHDRGGRVGYRDGTQDGICRGWVQVDDRNRVCVVACDESNV